MKSVTALESNDQVKLSGFGNFEIRDKNSRPGRNPKTGEEIPISARRVVTFKPGQKLKARVETMLEPSNNNQLPPIPGKRYFAIGEVSELCAVKPHVLRYWEQEFPSLSPVKRRGNRRYYQRQDVVLIRQIRSLLQNKGLPLVGLVKSLMTHPARKNLRPTSSFSIRQFVS